MGKLTHWAVTFAIIAVFSAFLGFGGVAGSAAPIAKTLFWLSLIVVGFSLSADLVRKT